MLSMTGAGEPAYEQSNGELADAEKFDLFAHDALVVTMQADDCGAGWCLVCDVSMPPEELVLSKGPHRIETEVTSGGLLITGVPTSSSPAGRTAISAMAACTRPPRPHPRTETAC